MGPIPTSILFPKPKPTYEVRTLRSHGFNMYSIDKQTCTLFIPCFSEDKSSISQKTLIYFHGNAEDLGQSIDWLLQMQKVLKMNVFANQYPGYGAHQKYAPSTTLISSEALILYRFIKERLGFDQKDIIIVGRSIGTGPACHVAGNSDCGTLVLISPFYNLKSMVSEKAGGWLSMIFKQGFPNDENIRKMSARLLNIHGEKDEVINVSNSKRIKQMYEEDIGREDGKFLQPPKMTHNQFDLMMDIILPMKHFLGDKPELNKDFKRIREVLEPIIIPE